MTETSLHRIENKLTRSTRTRHHVFRLRIEQRSFSSNIDIRLTMNYATKRLSRLEIENFETISFV